MNKLGSELDHLDNDPVLYIGRRSKQGLHFYKMQKKNKKESQAYSDTWNTKRKFDSF